MARLISNLLSFIKILAAVLIVCTAAGLVSSKIISHKLSKKLEEEKRSEVAKPQFFYNSIGATPALTTAKKLDFDVSQKYTIEVGYTKTRKGAEKVVDKLNQSGFPVFMTPVQLKSGRVAYKIRMGLFIDKKYASEASKTLQERTKYTGKLIALN